MEPPQSPPLSPPARGGGPSLRPGRGQGRGGPEVRPFRPAPSERVASAGPAGRSGRSVVDAFRVTARVYREDCRAHGQDLLSASVSAGPATGVAGRGEGRGEPRRAPRGGE